MRKIKDDDKCNHKAMKNNGMKYCQDCEYYCVTHDGQDTVCS